MHIVFLADPVDDQKAGVHMFTKHLIKNLLKYDKKNKYTFIHRRENPFFKDTNHIIIPGKEKRFIVRESLRKFFLIPRLVNKIKPDIVFEPSVIGPFNISKKTKRAVLIHDLTPILTPEYHNSKSVRTHKILLPRIIKNANLIITPSENTKQDIKISYPNHQKIEVVHPGIYPIKKDCTEKLKFEKPYILHLGTIEPRKNLTTLIKAFLKLKKEKKINHKLILAGGIGWKNKEILKGAAADNDIILTGYISEQEKICLLKNADIFVYPSYYEGFGMPPMEAMIEGIPTITSSGGSLYEIYKDNVLMHHPNDQKQLEKHLLKLINDNKFKKQLAEKQKIFAQKFTWKKSAKSLIKAFEQIK